MIAFSTLDFGSRTSSVLHLNELDLHHQTSLSSLTRPAQKHSAMSSLRASILHHSLPLLSTHSFTRHTLTLALASLRPDLTSSSTPLHANTEQEASTKRTKSTKVSRSKQKTHTKAEASSLASDNVLDTLFGSGTAPARALVRAWEDEGISKITQRPGDMRDRLRSRLEYSAQVGEHLVEVSAIQRMT